VGLDLVIGGAAAAVAVEVPTRGWLMNVLAQQPLHGLPLMALAAVGAGVAYLTLSGLARLQAVRLPVAPTERSR
jgi:CDP-diglyceride synthetase